MVPTSAVPGLLQIERQERGKRIKLLPGECFVAQLGYCVHGNPGARPLDVDGEAAPLSEQGTG